MSENKTTQGYVLLKAIDHGDWGGKKPIAFAETKEELEEFCEKNEYDYKGEKCVSAPTHYIESTEYYMGKLMLNPKNKCEDNTKPLKVRLLSIPYTELSRIFEADDGIKFRIFTRLREFIACNCYSNTKFTKIHHDEQELTRMDDILGKESSLVITITTPDNNTRIRMTQNEIYEALKDFLKNIYEYIPESRPYNGLQAIVPSVLPLKTIKDECFTFEIEDTNYKTHPIYGCMMSVNNDDEGRLVIKFRLLGNLQS